MSTQPTSGPNTIAALPRPGRGNDPDGPDLPGRPGGRDRPRRRPREGHRINWWLTALVVVLSLTIFVPLYFTVVTALKTQDQLGGTGFAFPSELAWGNFAEAWRLTNFPRSALNSAIITVGTVALTLLTNSMVAYAIARNMHRKLFKGLFFYFISALFVPFPILMLPVAKQSALLGMDNQLGLILLYVVYGALRSSGGSGWRAGEAGSRVM